MRKLASGGTKCGGMLTENANMKMLRLISLLCAAGTNIPGGTADNVSVTPLKLHKMTIFRVFDGIYKIVRV